MTAKRTSVLVVASLGSVLALCRCGSSGSSSSSGPPSPDAGDGASSKQDASPDGTTPGKDSSADAPSAVDGEGPDGGPEASSEASAIDAPEDVSLDVTCASPTSLACNGACVDPTLTSSCGACGVQCSAPPSTHGLATCGFDGGSAGDAGACGVQCATGYHACNLDCFDGAAEPSKDPCVVDVSGTGVFVSPGGSDTANDGSMAAPFQTFGKAIGVAVSGARRVYACVGTYAAPVALTAADDGVTVYGGLDCANGWKYVVGAAGAATLVEPASGTAPAGTALTVSGPLAAGLTFEDVTFESPASSVGATSSVAVFLTGGAKVTMHRGAVTAGAGFAGAKGISEANWDGLAKPGNGPGAGIVGGAGGLGQCSDGSTSSGGAGGSQVAGTYGPGLPGTSVPAVTTPLANGGSGGATCMAGTVGGSASAATPAGAAATSSGSATATGWVVGGPGGPGVHGNVAQGGGGGGGSDTGSLPGSGGGAGGCGGGRGLGGGTGGSSIAVLVYQSTVDLEGVTIVTGAGGTGGTGGTAQEGQSGGVPGTTGACSGGVGGPGSGGTGGGGGAGGNAIGVAWLGSTGPTIDGTLIAADQASPYKEITAGAKGAAGPGGGGGASAGTGLPASPGGNPGPAGSSNAVQQLH